MSLDEKTADGAATPNGTAGRRCHAGCWASGPLVLIAVLLGLFSLLNAPGLSKLSEGVPPKEEVAVEDIRLTPGQISITVRNEGPDPVAIAQVNVSDYYAMFTQIARNHGTAGDLHSRHRLQLGRRRPLRDGPRDLNRRQDPR